MRLTISTIISIFALTVPYIRAQSTDETIIVKPDLSSNETFRIDQSPDPPGPLQDPSLDDVDLSQFAMFAHPLPNTTTCPTIDPGAILQDSEPHQRRRRSVTTSLHRRARTITPFGTTLESIPASSNTQDTTAKRMALTLNAQGSGRFRSCSVTANTVSVPVSPRHPLPLWEDLEGTVRGSVTIEESFLDIVQHMGHGNEFLVDSLLGQALALRRSVVPFPYVHAGTSSVLDRNTDLAGPWSFTMIAFGDVPGYSFQVSRRVGPWAVGHAGLNAKAMSVAAILIASLTLDLLIYELEHPKGALGASDVVMIQILLSAVKHLVSIVLYIESNGDMTGPEASAQEVKLAIRFFAAGRMGGGMEGAQSSGFFSKTDFLAKLRSDPVCRANIRVSANGMIDAA